LGAELACGQAAGMTHAVARRALYACCSWWRSGQGSGEGLASCWGEAGLMDCNPASRRKEQGHRRFHPGGVWEREGTCCPSYSREG